MQSADRIVEVYSGAAAVLVPCASRKRLQPDRNASAVSLHRSDQTDLETAWLQQLRKLPVACEATELYGGRGFQLARQASTIADAPLYIVSAGLGLVAAERPVPTYGLTVSGRGPESIAARVNGRFDAVSWWHAVNKGPYSTPLASIFKRNASQPVVIALSQPYARMLASSLDALTDADVARLRVIGVNLDTVLSSRFAPSLLPYDERLEAIMPGTRADFPQRALLHFASEGLAICPGADASTHSGWVQSALAGRRAPARRQRPRLSDDDILALIKRHLPTMTGIGRLLRVLRNQEGVACEQARFSRLYRAAIEERTAA
ncbi:MAG: hypothetical protein EOR69_32010 [Mesorhizobium sp.]|nr:MAG: hypothetical protein EOR69_32010 [Mesorhizobium sp.]RWL92277.1 MAG: hypothetical protein EOR70_32175 [Mesorhizobium sp.]